MSPARRLISAGLPAPSTSTRSASAASRSKAASTAGSRARRQLPVIARRRAALYPAAQHDLRRAVRLRLQQHRVHVADRRDAAGPRLQRLRPADLAAICRHRGVVRHVLRLERPHPEPAPRKGARQPGDEQRLADIGAGALQHQRAGHARRLRRAPHSPHACPLYPAQATRRRTSPHAGEGRARGSDAIRTRSRPAP